MRPVVLQKEVRNEPDLPLLFRFRSPILGGPRYMPAKFLGSFYNCRELEKTV